MSYLGDLPPSERSLRARLAASARHAKSDGRETTAAARAASPGSDDYWLSRVDPDRVLNRKEREKRARNAKREHFIRMALQSAKARRRKRGVR